MAQFRDLFDAAQDPQAAAFALRLGQLYNVTQPTFAIGELIYSDTATTLASLAPNTAASKKFLSMTGTGSAGAAPVWETIEAADITDFSEAVDDRVDALIQDGTGITWSYNDGAGTLTPTVSLGAFDTDDLAEGSTNLYYTDERVDDRAAVLIQNGTGISWSYNDGAGTLTPTVTLAPFSTSSLAEGSNLYYTDERVDDRVAVLIVNGNGIQWSYNDGAGTLTGTVDSASTTVDGIVELATDAETVTGTDTARATTPSNITARLAAPGTIGGTTAGAGNFTTLTAQTSFGLSRSGNAPAIALTRTDTHGDAAQVGVITFTGVDSGAAAQQYAEIRIMATLDNAGAEEGDIKLFVTTGGTSTEIASITGATTTFTNALAINGNTTLGNASTDTVVINAKSFTRPNMPGFLVYNSATDSNVTGNGTVATVDFDTEIMDRGGDFATDTFTAPVTGLYSFSGAIAISGLVADTSLVSVNLVTSNRTYLLALVEANRASLGIPFATHADMDSGDTATITVTATGDAADNADILGVSSGSNPQTYWGGHLVG